MSAFPDKTLDEIVDVSIDFTNLLATGETIAAANWSALDLNTNTAAPGILQTGGSQIDGAVCSQRIVDGTAWRNYRLSCEITTSEGRVYVERATMEVIA